MNGEDRRQVKTAVRVFDVIQSIQSQDGSRLVDIADELDVSKSTAHQYLTTLVDLGYLQKSGQIYDLSLKFLDHGTYARDRYDIVQASQPTLTQLSEKTREIAWIVVEENGKAVYLTKSKGERGIQTLARIGTRAHLHYIASGKAILSHISEERTNEIIEEHGLPSRTEQSITDKETLLEELAEIHEQGYAINDQEGTPGVRAVGAPIVVNDEIKGAISITGPASRLNDEILKSDFVSPLINATNEIAIKLGYQIE